MSERYYFKATNMSKCKQEMVKRWRNMQHWEKYKSTYDFGKRDQKFLKMLSINLLSEPMILQVLYPTKIKSYIFTQKSHCLPDTKDWNVSNVHQCKYYRQSGCQEERTALDVIKSVFNIYLFLHFLILEVFNRVQSLLFLFNFIGFCFSSLSPFLCSFLCSFFLYTLSFLCSLLPSFLLIFSFSLLSSFPCSSFSPFIYLFFSFLHSMFPPHTLYPLFPSSLYLFPTQNAIWKTSKWICLRETKSCCLQYEGEVCPCSIRRQQSCWRV